MGRFKTPFDVRSYARSFDKSAIQCLAGVMRSAAAPAAARVAAANSLLDRGHGKPDQSHDFNADIQITIRRLLDAPEQLAQLVDVTPHNASSMPAIAEEPKEAGADLPPGQAGKRTRKMGPKSDVPLDRESGKKHASPKGGRTRGRLRKVEDGET